MMKWHNPSAFVPMSVTLITTIAYLAIVIPLLVIHETVPSAPSDNLYRGLNLTEAWFDLDELTNGYHPFNSQRNDDVRNWLLVRIGQILYTNGVDWSALGGDHEPYAASASSPISMAYSQVSPPKAVVFNDLVANYTSTALTRIGVSGRRAGISTYFEGSNIIVYIRGTEDEKGEWWKPVPPYTRHYHAKGGVMVNAHIDSVSTGYGATDDGVGIVTALQLIKYFTTEGNTPKRGVVALFNNGEEDGLYGAKAFLSHPMASFVHTFLNLEGAGAGGRATLFRSTDAEVTRAYATSPYPFGTIVSADGFALGYVRSETDYIVFRAEGYRGLDLAFWEPRSRYHTDQDDTKHTSKASLWHMLSASVETMRYLTTDTDEFTGPRGDNTTGKVRNGSGTDGVWFDIFGRYFAVFGLRTLFAWSLTLLISTPLVLMLISYILVRQDKYYLFAGTAKAAGHESEAISLQGWRGAFRFPIVFVISAAITLGAAFLLKKFNPLIIYSSQYSVWTMSLSLFLFTFWFLMAGCNAIRPSALHRVYALIWMFAFSWLLLIAATVAEDRFRISSGYILVFYEAAAFSAAFIGLCELFALPTKTSVVESVHDEHENRDALAAIPSSSSLDVSGNDGHSDRQPEEDAPSEETPLIGGNGHRISIGATFSRGYRRSISDQHESANDPYEGTHSFGYEQKWAAKLPSWTWLLQFLILGPFTLIIVGQVGLLLVTATAQTGTDGNALLLPYIIVALFSTLLILPLTPFMHRITHHIPIFLLLVFLGSLIYNLVAFPFSAGNRCKTYFQQTVDLDTGLNHVTLVGIEEHVRDIISYIPTAADQTIICTTRPEIRNGLSFCSYDGLAPAVVNHVEHSTPREKSFQDWLSFDVIRSTGENKATFNISALQTKACVIRFDLPFSAFHVHGSAPKDERWDDVPESGSDQIKLWHRDWNREWIVDVEWPVSEGMQMGDEQRSGRVVCLWSDYNQKGTIPALDELHTFMPVWASVTKLMDGLVEGSKAFTV